jgi:nucleoside-diphosphate-sugar epimerase
MTLGIHLLLLALLVPGGLCSVFIIGASGAIGRRLTEHLLSEGIPVVAGIRRSPLPEHITSHPLISVESGVDCRDADSLRRVFAANPSIDTVWNLAAPLSVETAADPALAHDVVVGGMRRLLDAMREYSVPNINFSDSIGSYGAECPRETAIPAAWLVENPKQDPGSDYGRQKRECR